MIKCELCNRQFKSFTALSKHLSKIHHFDKQLYFNIYYLKSTLDGFCKTCGKPTKFLEFVKYDEGIMYCNGILTLKINDTIFTFGNKKECDFPKFWTSGGYVDTNTGDVVVGPWLPYSESNIIDKFEKIFDENPYTILHNCLAVMDENIQQGCCGECL